MKIGIVASNWRPISEAEKNIFAPGLIILNLADSLVEKGHDVTLFAPKNTVTKARLISENLNSVYEDYRDLLYSDLPTFLKLEQQYEMVLLSKAFEVVNEENFDIVHVHKTNIEPYFSNFIKCPLLITSHNSYRICKTTVFSKADEIRLKKYKNTCYYTALSDYIKNEVDLNFVGVIGNGIDIEKYSFNNTGNDQLLFAGRLIQSKGPDVAFQVAEQLQKEINVIGDIRAGKNDKLFAEDIIRRINGSKYGHYLGFIKHNEISQYFSNAKALLFPISEPEGFGITLIESMATGTPVVAYDLGAVREIIDNGKTGFLCPPGDNDCLIESVKKIYSMSKEEYLNMRQACRKKVEEKYTLSEMVNRYEEVYKKVILNYKKS